MTTRRLIGMFSFGGAALLGIVVSGCQSRSTAAPTTRSPESPQQLVYVETLSPEQVDWQRTTTQPATVHAYFESHVYAKVSGYLTELKADIGQQVEQGEVLAVLEVPELVKRRQAKLAEIKRLEADERRATAELAVTKASVDSCKAKVAQAQADVGKADALLSAHRIELTRVRDLVDQKSVAERLLDEATKKHDSAQAEKTSLQAAITSAEAEHALAKSRQEAAQADLEVSQAMTEVARHEVETLDEMLKYRQLRSPLAGVVTHRSLDPGDLVHNAQNGSGAGSEPLFVVAQLDKVRVRVAVPERDAPLVNVGDEVHVTLQALPGEVFPGQVSRISSRLADSTRTMMVEVDLDNPDRKLLPGMFGQATFALDPRRKRLALPAAALRFDEQGNSRVYVVDASNQVQIVDVQTGLDDGARIEITAGLTGDERVVGPLLERLQPGQRVNVR